jgi:hypothetical protein
MKYYFLSLASLFLIASCTKDKITSSEDSQLYQEVVATSAFSWYKNDPTIVASSSGSGHAGFFRVRFNAIAAAAFDTSGKLPVDSVFPAGSIVVKELFNSASSADLREYAVIKKDPGSSNSEGGWLWAEYEPGGGVKYSTSNKGSACVGCHSAQGHRDLVRVFEIFP